MKSIRADADIYVPNVSPHEKLYPLVKFMIASVAKAATNGASYVSFPMKNSPQKIYCCYFVCTAEVQFVSNS